MIEHKNEVKKVKNIDYDRRYETMDKEIEEAERDFRRDIQNAPDDDTAMDLEEQMYEELAAIERYYMNLDEFIEERKYYYTLSKTGNKILELFKKVGYEKSDEFYVPIANMKNDPYVTYLRKFKISGKEFFETEVYSQNKAFYYDSDISQNLQIDNTPALAAQMSPIIKYMFNNSPTMTAPVLYGSGDGIIFKTSDGYYLKTSKSLYQGMSKKIKNGYFFITDKDNLLLLDDKQNLVSFAIDACVPASQKEIEYLYAYHKKGQ